MKRSIRLDVTPDEVKQAILEFARDKYYRQPNISPDSGVYAAQIHDVVFQVENVDSGTVCQADQLTISAKIEIEHEFT